MSADVRFTRFLSMGRGLTGHALGALADTVFHRNGVELQFSVGPGVRQQYSDLKPVQYEGTSSIWLKSGSALGGTWKLHGSSQGNGWDNPEKESIHIDDSTIAYYDAPGPNVARYLDERPSRIHVIQNFTGWVVGTPAHGGLPERLCAVTAWHGIVSIADENWGQPGSIPRWVRVHGNRSGLGWANTATPPPI